MSEHEQHDIHLTGSEDDTNDTDGATDDEICEKKVGGLVL